jgi:NAD(P)-dependent dehydrogenase (short-subunit alcohol dehydrogenase family)
MTSFDGRLAFVFGGSMGIGLAVAEQLAGVGADVVVFARRAEPLVEAAGRIQARRRRAEQRVAWRQLDVSDRRQVETVLGAIVSDLGVPDILVNCAGRARPAYFEQITPAQLEETLRINLVGCWNTIQVLLPHMRGRRGHIVNTASLAGLIGVFGYTDYCASKFALIGFSEALRGELAPGEITVSVLCPPDVDTPGFAEENRNKPPETIAVSGGAGVLDAATVAHALLAGMAKRRFLIIPGREARLTYLLKRWLPGLVSGVMARQVRRARRPSVPVTS